MRRRYVWDAKAEALVELPSDWAPTPRTELITGAAYEGTRATDGTDVSTRRKHADYMKRNGLALASEFRESWAKAAAERERAASGDFDTKARREAIGRAVHQKWKG